MSMRQVIDTVMARLADEDTGLAVKLALLLETAESDFTQLPREFVFRKWRLASKLAPGDAHQITVRPAGGEETVRVPQKPDTDNRQQIEVLAETVHGDVEQLQDLILLLAIAFQQCLVDLREYSDATGGTVELVEDPIRFQYGARDTEISSSGGWSCTLTIQERSTE